MQAQTDNTSQPEPLLPRVAAGDPAAVSEVLDRYGGLVWSLARRLSTRPDDAEDAVQEIFIDIWKSAERFKPEIASEKTFIAMIARRRLIDRRRKAGRQPATDPILPHVEAVANGGQQALETGVEARLASRALADLKPKERNVVLLSAYHGFSHGQIADRTGLPLGTVKTYVRRGLMRVREKLASTGADGLGEAGA